MLIFQVCSIRIVFLVLRTDENKTMTDSLCYSKLQRECKCMFNLLIVHWIKQTSLKCVFSFYRLLNSAINDEFVRFHQYKIKWQCWLFFPCRNHVIVFIRKPRFELSKWFLFWHGIFYTFFIFYLYWSVFSWKLDRFDEVKSCNF